MKIGIVTQPLHFNYGGLLQNYALQQVLKEMGHQPCTLDWTRVREPEMRRITRNIKNKVLYTLHLKKDCKIKDYRVTPEEFATIGRYTIPFVNRYITRTRVVNTSAGFRRLFAEGGYDALISGSDQVWRPKYSNPFLKEMFLCFAVDKGVRRVAYAASLGTDVWEYSKEMTTACASLAQKFDHISVREDSGIALCQDYLGVAANLVLDPTLLLQQENYSRLVIEAGDTKSIGSLFYYILDPTAGKTDFIKQAGREMGLNPFTIAPGYMRSEWTRFRIRHRIEQCVCPPVTQWLRGFMDAEMTIVDSFHGMAFSIIFNKPFWAIGNKSRGLSRFTSLLKLLGLEDRLVDPAELDSVRLSSPINWQCVNQALEANRQHSIDWLANALK